MSLPAHKAFSLLNEMLSNADSPLYQSDGDLDKTLLTILAGARWRL